MLRTTVRTRRKKSNGEVNYELIFHDKNHQTKKNRKNYTL